MLAGMMTATSLITKTRKLCDWCGRESTQPLLTVTIVTPRGAFRDDICEPCRKAFEDSAE